MDHQINTESINLLGGSAPVHAVARSDHSTFGSDEINQLNKLMHDLTREECDIERQLEWLESRGKKRKRQVDDWLDQVQELKNKTDDMNNSFDQHGLTDLYGLDMQPLIEEVKQHKQQKPLVLSNEFVGESFEGNVKKVWELLGNDQVFIIGVYGMGGVGKTCLVTHMEDEIKRKGIFKHVFWVTVSRNFSISKLQQDIAERIGAKLYGDDERVRAANLSLALETKEKSVLILDDVWKFIDLQKVGILPRVNGSKLILTSRLERVCRQMDCPANNIIRMDLLSDNEGFELFLLKLGLDAPTETIPPNVLRIAESIASECHGLPLGITIMARTMKGVKVNSIHRWRHELNKLREFEMRGEMEEEVFKVLKLSYDNLMQTCMQNCFLNCALYSQIECANEPIMKLVESGAINGTRNLEEIFDEGHTILDELKDYSLLFESSKKIWMHNPNRYMACYIWKGIHKCMIKCDRGLTKIPHMQEWTTDLEVVSLDSNDIEEIPVGTSPCCPQLSTLILSYNLISSIPDCFFIQMKTLTILDLSYNIYLTALPSSLSDLRSLISLVLTGCEELECVPPLGALQALSRLDISTTSVKEVPGLEMLTNLRWLDLSYNTELGLQPGTVLPGSTNLQYLDLRFAGCLDVKSEDVQEMTMLECFGGHFHDCQNYNNYVENIENRGYGPKYYSLLLDSSEMFEMEYALVSIAPEDDECRSLVFGDCEESPHRLPRDLAKLFIDENTHWMSLCSALSSTDSSSLGSIQIKKCTKLERLFCLFGYCSLCTNLQNLESLRLYNLESLIIICEEDVDDRSTPALSPNGVFSHLRDFQITRCNGIETLVTPGLLSQLQNLETIIVEKCDSVREIFAVSSSDGDVEGASTITLPKLTKLKLIDLLLLETVSKGVIICESMPELKIDECPNLESNPTIQVSS